MAPPTPTPIPIPSPHTTASSTSATAAAAAADNDIDIDADPFSHPQNLESTYYDEGFALGRADGARAGRIEGRVFGLEKGFDKFFAMGALAGRAGVWGPRLGEDEEPPAASKAITEEGGKRQRLGGLPSRVRLRTHVHALHALAEAASLETRNTEDGVADFDDRLRRAQAKLKVIEGLVGERGGGEKEEEEREEDDGAEAQAERNAGEELEVEVTMGDVEVRLEEERERERERRKKEEDMESRPALTAAASASGGAKKPPRTPKRAGVKVAGGARRGEKNMEDFGIGDARALGRLI
ncbi:hypothetical protein IWX90DRAFT_410671 [Phyllosticta citrichinensis]|uniref:Essential protein Yae1 N-terminal domain-containing protein n=1 Tax=Phyllosticta citrichinensis TaxID=1130410 RepID=A0ABR1Y5N1_9PEZI